MTLGEGLNQPFFLAFEILELLFGIELRTDALAASAQPNLSSRRKRIQVPRRLPLPFHFVVSFLEFGDSLFAKLTWTHFRVAG